MQMLKQIESFKILYSAGKVFISLLQMDYN